METKLKCNNGAAELVIPKAGNSVKEPYVPGKINVDLSDSDLQQKVTIRCVAQPRILGSDRKDALVMSHGNLIDVMMTNTTTKNKKLSINIKINSSIIK